MLFALFAVQAANAALPSWRVQLKGTQATRTIVPDAKALKSPIYSLRFRAAITDAHGGGTFSVKVAGRELKSYGRCFLLMKVGAKGSEDFEGKYANPLQDCGLHDFVFIRRPEGIRWTCDGLEQEPIAMRDASAPFAFVIEKADVEIDRFETVAADMTGVWTVPNTEINGGFEQLVNGYPVGWSTGTFGRSDAKSMADMDSFRRYFRVDTEEAFEGKCSFLVVPEMLGMNVSLVDCIRQRLTNTAYVASVWMKAARAGTWVTMSVKEGRSVVTNAALAVPTAWTRFALPFRTTDGKGTGVEFHLPKDAGAVHFDAVQIERGTEPTAFTTLPFHDVVRSEIEPRVYDVHMPEKPVAKVRNPPVPPKCPRADLKHNAITFGGKPFYLNGVTVELDWTNLADYKKVLDRLKSYRINCIGLWNRGTPKTVEDLRAALDEGEKRGIKTYFGIEYDKKNGYRPKHPEALARIRAVKDHPGIYMLGLLDEVYFNVTPEQRREIADEVRAATGGTIPILFNEFHSGTILNCDHSAADITSGDYYYCGTLDLSYLWGLVSILRANNPDKIVQWYPQAAGHLTHEWMRDPTPEEIKVQAYMGYVNEVFNVVWWANQPLTAPVMPAIAETRRELDEIGPAEFMDGERAAVRCASYNDKVKFAAREKDGVLTIISVNVSTKPCVATWTLPKTAGEAKVLFENRSVYFGGTTFRDAYGPMERHVYRLTGSNGRARAPRGPLGPQSPQQRSFR